MEGILHANKPATSSNSKW